MLKRKGECLPSCARYPVEVVYASPVGYVACPCTAQELNCNIGRKQLRDAVEHVITAGADVVNIAFLNETTTKMALQIIEVHVNEVWSRRAVRPAITVVSTGAVISYILTNNITLTQSLAIDTETGHTANALLMTSEMGPLVAIVVSWPKMQQDARIRRMQSYVTAAKCMALRDGVPLTIGGMFSTPPVFIERIVDKMQREVVMESFEPLTVLTSGLQTACAFVPGDNTIGIVVIADATQQRQAKHARQSIATWPPAEEATPLYDEWIQTLSAHPDSVGDAMEAVAAIMEQLMWGDVRYRDARGNPVQEPVPVHVKMERLLQTTREQRAQSLWEKGDRRGAQVYNGLRTCPQERWRSNCNPGAVD